jgi:Endonuclease NucS C-terminal domain
MPMQNWDDVRRRHYVRKATAENHWFDFMSSRVRDYRARFGDQFCLVVNGSDTREDAYIIPYTVARDVFTDAALDGRGRWVGTIVGNTLTLAPTGNTLNVSAFHNAFKLLDSSETVSAGVAGAEAPPISDALDDAIETTLHLESDLETFLLAELGQLERGLKLFDANGTKGRQLDAGAAGRIDILAIDAQGDFVVIEIKAGEADRQVCGQVQAYMGWVAEHLAKGRTVRGIVVASDFTERLKLAAKVVPQLSLKSYSVVFRFRDG